MADTLQDSVSSLQSLSPSFGSAIGSGSRPSSRAQSEVSFATTRPGSSAASTRNISHEIDHIKALISRSVDAPRKPTQRMSAQVFRPRSESISSSITNINHAHIFHELDQLKRRIRQEQEQLQQAPQLVRRTSQIDPGLESDSDHEEVPDEREVELEHAREDAIVVRQRLDGLLEIAERNVDNLTAEKEKLESLCEQRKEGLVVAAVERKKLTKALDIARSSIEYLKDELQQTVLDHQRQILDVQNRMVESDAAADRSQQQVVLLESQKVELEASLAAAKNEEKRYQEEIERLTAERAASDASFQAEITKLQDKVDREVAESVQRAAEIQELRENLAETQAASIQANDENAERRDQLLSQIEEGKKLLQQALHDAAAKHAAHQEVIQSRDQLTTEVEQFQIKLGTAVYQRERTEKQLSDARAEHEEQNCILVENHEKLVAELQSSVESIHSRLQERDQMHSSAVDELAKQHGDALKELKSSHHFELEQTRIEASRNAGDGHAKAVEELTAQHATALETLIASHQAEMKQVRLETERKAAQANEDHARMARESAAQQSKALEDLKTSHQAEIERIQQDAERGVKEVNADHARILSEVKTQHAQAIEDLKASSQAEAERTRAEAIRGKDEDHAKVLAELHGQHRELINQANLDSEQRVEQLTSVCAQKDEVIVKLQQDHQEAVQQAVELMQKRESERTEEDERRMSEHNAVLNKIRDDAERRAGELRDAHALELQRSTSEHHASNEAARKEQLELHEGLLEAVRKEAADREAKMANAHAEEHASFEARILKLHSEHEESLASVKAEHDAAVLESAARHAAENEAAQIEARTRIDELRAANEAAIAAMEEKHSQALAGLTKNQSESAQAGNERLALMQASHEAELKARDSQHEQLVAQLRADYTSQFDASLVQHKQSITELQEEHRIELAREHERTQKAIAEAEVAHRSALESLTADNQSAVSRLQADLSSVHKELENLKTLSAEEKALTVSEHQDQVGKLERSWSQVAEDTLKAHNADLQKAADEAARHLDAATQRFQEQLSERESAEASRVAAFQDVHAQEKTCIRENAKTELESAQAELESTKQQLLAAHSEEIARLRSEYETLLENTRVKHQVEIDALRDRLEVAESMMRTAIEDHGRITTELRTGHDAELQRLKAEHDRETNEIQTKGHAEMELLRKDSVEVLSRVSAIEAGCDARIEDLKQTHDAELTILKNEVAAYVGAIKLKTEEADLMKQHIESLQTRLEEVRLEAEDRASTVQTQNSAVLDTAMEKAQQNGQAELRNLKKRHQDAVSQIRITAQKQAAAQLTDLEKAHQKEIENFSNSTAEAHQGDIMRLETEHQTKFAELASRLRDERDAEISSKESAYQSEMTALQARVDAALTGQAEAERTVALLRKQAAKTDRRSLESKSSAEDQVANLQKESEDLSRQLSLVQSSLRDSQRDGGSGDSSPTRTPEHGELASLKLQLDNLEEERLAMRRAMEKRSTEKSELVRQNDFLVKELEVLLAQRARAKKTSTRMADALVQTDPFISEPKVDLSSVQLLKDQASSRPMTPLSPGQRQAKDEVEMAWRTRSFEDYLDNGLTEPSQLGSVISANEDLFARKTSQHSEELETAKDQLAADYDAKINGLAADREMVEAMVLPKQQAAFAKERKELVDNYTLGTSPIDESDRESTALRNAEERLVADYNKKIFRRKSQIALKHAEEYQNLTREYDRKVADLLDNRSRLEGDLSVDPTQFEQDMDELQDELQTRSARLAERYTIGGSERRPSRVSPSPMPSSGQGMGPHSAVRRRSPTSPAAEDRARTQIRTSTPRTSLSLPRSSSVPRAALSVENSGQRHLRASLSPSPMPSSEQGLRPNPTRRQSPTSPAADDRARTRIRTSTPRTSLSLPRSSSVPRAALSVENSGAQRAGSRSSSSKSSERHPPVPQLSLMRVKTPSDVNSTPPVRDASGSVAGPSSPLPSTPPVRDASAAVAGPSGRQPATPSPSPATPSQMNSSPPTKMNTSRPAQVATPSLAKIATSSPAKTATSSPVKMPMSSPSSSRQTSQPISPRQLSSRQSIHGAKAATQKHLSVGPSLRLEQRPIPRQSSYVKGEVSPRVLEPSSKLGFLRRVVDKISPSSPSSEHQASPAGAAHHHPGRPGSSASMHSTPTLNAGSSSHRAARRQSQSQGGRLSSGMIYNRAPRQSPPARGYDL